MKRHILPLVLMIACASAAYAEKRPQPLTSDQRIRQVMYSPNEVYEIVGTYGFQTTIEFAQDEDVRIASIGDSIGWQVVPMGSRVFAKPVEDKATTNLTVVTNKRVYYFYLMSSRNQAKEATTYLVRFVYDQGVSSYPAANASPSAGTSSASPRLAKEPTDYNFDYAISGDKAIELKLAFDDGQFTYLLFAKTTDLPAVFSVDKDGRESLVNSRIEGRYVVIERVASQYTLRNGAVTACLYNKSRPLQKDKIDAVARANVNVDIQGK